jgi:hypothetical protein
MANRESAGDEHMTSTSAHNTWLILARALSGDQNAMLG